MNIFNLLCPISVETSGVTKMERDALNFRVYSIAERRLTFRKAETAECWTTE